MSECGLCGISLSQEDQAVDKAVFCCKSCLQRSKILAETHRQLDEALDATLRALVSALDVRERKTAEHSRRVARYSMILAEELGISGDQCKQICRGALLHDIGKIGIPDEVLLKAGPLNDSEWVLMRRHPELGAEILSAVPSFSEESEVVLAHQERYDGSGYPRGLSGDAIPLGARIFAVSDTLDALLSDRPYQQAVSFEVALTRIWEGSGITFDPLVVEALLRSKEDIRQATPLLCVS